MPSKKVLLFLFAIFLVICTLLGFEYFHLKNTNTKVVTTSTQKLTSGTTVTFKTIDTSIELDTAKIDSFLKRFNLSIEKPLEIEINYQSGKKPDEAMTTVVNKDQKIYTTITGDRYSENISVVMYVDKNEWSTLPVLSQRKYLQLALAQALIAIDNGNADSLSDKRFNEYFNQIFTAKEDDLWFSVTKKSIFSGFKLVSEVKADSCGGAYTCSTTETGYMCSNGTACSDINGSPCSPASDCQLRSSCVPSFQKLCSAYVGPPACNQISCGPGSCASSGSCYLISSSTPSPTSTPPSGGGSCTSGDPFYGYNNCGDVGRVNGSGSCGSGCLCCATSGTFNPPSCSLGVHNGSLTGPLLNNGQNYNIPLNVNKLTASGVSTNGFVQYINYYVSDITKSYLSPGPASKSYHFCDCVGSGCTNFYTGGACGNTNPQFVTTQYVHGASILTPYSVLTVTATCKGAGGTVQKIQNFNLVPFSNPAWWQTKGGDVMSGDDLTSRVPATCTGACIPDLILDAPSPQGSGYPGLAVYNTSYDFSNGTGSGNTSSKNWLAQSTYTGKIYDYNYFDTLVPSDVSFVNVSGDVSGGTFKSQGTPNKGYVWFKSNGDLNINSKVDLNARKVILLVNGNLTVSGNGGGINVDDGQGFFMAIVSGTTTFDPGFGGSSASPSIEGLFLSDQGIFTSVGTTAFYMRGSIVANGALNLQRDLGTTNNQTKPAEVFEYAPDMILNFPRSLARSRVIWQEVAP